MRDGSGPRLAVASVLVLEDDEAVAQALIDVIDDAGCLPLPARTLAEARALLASEQPSLVLLDLTLHDEYGGALLDDLRADPDAPPVIIVSGFALAPIVGQ